MSDDEDKRGQKDNTHRVHKVKFARNRENAPTGQLGTNRLKPLSPGLGGNTSPRNVTQAREQSEPARDQGAGKTEPKTMFVETGDKDVDSFYEKTDQKVSQEEADRMKAEQAKAKEIAQKFKSDREQEKGKER